MRGVGGPLLCIGDLLSDVGEAADDGSSFHSNPEPSFSRSSSSSLSTSVPCSDVNIRPSELPKLFQETYDNLNEALAGMDHSWTVLTLKLCTALETANKLVQPSNSNVRLLSEKARSDGQRGGGRIGGRGAGRGRGRRFNRDSADNENSFGSNDFSGGYGRQPVEGDVERNSERRGYGGPRGGPRGGRRGGFSNGEVAEGERPRRVFDRHSGTGRGNEYSKRDGAGRGNWGTPIDDIAPATEEPVSDAEKTVDTEKPSEEEVVGDANKESPVAEPEEKEPENKWKG